MKNHKQHGFTIVELLIVVVVIAILAAITIVSYNGIINRANNTKMLSAADAWTKTLLLYKAEAGQFPKVPTGYATDNWCVGANFPETNDFPEGACFVINDPANGLNNYTSGFIHNNDFDTEIKKITTIPNLEFDPIIITNGTMTMKMRGLMYIGGANGGTLFYYIAQDAECARGTKDGSSTLTRCVININ